MVTPLAQDRGGRRMCEDSPMRLLRVAAALGVAAAVLPMPARSDTQKAPSPSPSPGLVQETRPVATASPELCGLLARCALPVDPAFCTPALSAGVAGVTYDEGRCAEA